MPQSPGVHDQGEASFLSLTRPGDIAFAARVELSGGETMGHLHKLITVLTRGITSTYELGAAAPPGTALEILVGKRHQLALHSGHVLGLTQLLRHAVDTIDAHATSSDGLCRHCYGTGRAHSLWEVEDEEPESQGKP
ncbi:hypothetical protein ACGFX2_32910 [Streptomyces goshikiensis]|uniref:hypothetical protein n=1 Tax=Streptomyces goshikiensis TaxID=1942 RepID=UPI00370FFC2E